MNTDDRFQSSMEAMLCSGAELSERARRDVTATKMVMSDYRGTLGHPLTSLEQAAAIRFEAGAPQRLGRLRQRMGYWLIGDQSEIERMRDEPDPQQTFIELRDALIESFHIPELVKWINDLLLRRMRK